ncbi:MerR family transcriptional regulator [Anaeromicropila herbilytica]|uniref:MerR family transcriptional regulator n=1 Tax=Anaeromicropila herbilytica TaxID=2785025 RepID=A0A7R7EHR5_9FIRM|nr:MerR family transcriptional regulator [Anaeromicropila herbilytica]BCN29081.1 MerR family transcriptional regulator [Anaeromicropila herbilytica]
MLINEASKKTNLTKKAIEYYTEHGLIFPEVLENGYRYFNESDIERLNHISVLRKLGLSTVEIKAVLDDKSGDILKDLSLQKELSVQREQRKKDILYQLSCGKSYDEISDDMKAIEQSATITEKLLGAFPGYYGRFICLHFARFLNEVPRTKEQKLAYNEIIEFLDNVPSINFPEEIQAYFDESTEHMTTNHINKMLDNMKQTSENPERFLEENKEMLEQYLAFRQSDEYKNSPMYQLQCLLQEFNRTSGYNDIFIPAMKRLSVSYAEYSRQLVIANEKFLSKYPEAEKILTIPKE